MLIYATGQLPLRSKSLDQALCEFVEYARRHLVAHERSEISIAIGESSARIHEVLARLLPGETKEFYVGRLRVGPPLSAAQFLESVARANPKQTHSMVSLRADDVLDPFGLLEALAEVAPPSGRGVMLLLILRGWTFTGESIPTEVDATLSRMRVGSRVISAILGLRFHALSLKDSTVAATIAAASQRAHVRFGKPMAGFAAAANIPFGAPAVTPPDTRLQPPKPESQLLVLQTFEEAMGRAAEQIGTQPVDLRSLPLLFSRSGGFDKRIKDVMAGKKETVNLPAWLRRFMREQFPGYTPDAGDSEQVWFRNAVAPTLDLLLMFDKVHQWGLGKTFTVNFGVDFPNTPFGGMHTGLGGTRKNIFWLFHEGWEERVWTYTTGNELEVALQSCGDLLRRILPALEQHCRELLLPPPTVLPNRIEQRGPLSARDAYNLVLPIARTWAGDAKLESIGCLNLLSMGAPVDSVEGLGEGGRLLASGSWGFKFLSKHLDRYCYYSVPRIGRVWWGFFPVLQGAIPKYSAVLESDDWLDSTEVAPRALQALRQQLGITRAHQFALSLHDPQRYSGKFVWEASCISIGATPSERRLVSVQLDRRSGEILGTDVR